MRRNDGRPLESTRNAHAVRRSLSRSAKEFLRVPLAVVAALTLLAIFAISVDTAAPPWLRPLHEAFVGLVAPDSAPELLAAIASSVVAIASITFSVLLLAVQQAATSFTSVVYDQYLRRRSNQLYFGFFVGLSVYAVIVLASERPGANLAFGVALALLLTIVALAMLVVLIYGTIDQMRPATVVRGIHDLALRARRGHLPLLAKTRPAPTMAYDDAVVVTATESGFVTAIDAEALGALARDVGGEVLLKVRIGTHVVLGEVVARVGRGPAPPPRRGTVRARRAQARAGAAHRRRPGVRRPPARQHRLGRRVERAAQPGGGGDRDPGDGRPARAVGGRRGARRG